MIVLNAADTIAGVASAASQVTCTITGIELASGIETHKVLDQRQLPSSVATIYTAPALTQSFVLSIFVVNNDSVSRTFQLFVKGTAAVNVITPLISLLPGAFAIYTEMGGWSIYSSSQMFQLGGFGNLLNVHYFTSGTPEANYIPTTACRAIYVECIGGGGGGGGVLDAATNAAAGGGGGAGAYSAAFITTLQAYLITIGAGGGGGAAGANDGTAGGDTSFGAACIAKGGSGGKSDTVTTLHAGGLGGVGGLASGGTGDIKNNGGNGERGITLAAAQAISGRGGDSYIGAGAPGIKTQGNGTNAISYGSGGSGGLNLSSAASQAGGNGVAGLIRVWEFG